MRTSEEAALIILYILRDHEHGFGQPFSIDRSLVAKFLQRLDEGEMIAGILYARRCGWLVIEGSDVRITKAGLRAVVNSPQDTQAA